MIRGAASFYVAVSHIFSPVLASSPYYIKVLMSFGQEAVITFFLISGFVISISEQKQQVSIRQYILKRFLRIYPIFVVGCILGLIFSCSNNEIHAVLSWRKVLGNIFMLQDFSAGKPGVFTEPLGGVTPLWSLSYEWWFYMLFIPFNWLFPRPWRVYGAIIISFLGAIALSVWPSPFGYFSMYFIIWWNGVELAYLYQKNTKECVALVFKAIVGLGLIASVWFLMLHNGKLGQVTRMGLHPLLELRHLLAALFVILCSLAWWKFSFKGFNFLFGKFEKLGNISYGLYATHYPVAVTGIYLNWISSVILRCFIYLLISLVVAWIVEKVTRQLSFAIYKKIL